MDFQQLQKELGVHFTNEKLLKQAFTHSSYVNEHRGKPFADNERLEFLGDAVLELTISQFLFMNYPKLAEGELTKLRAAIVCEPSLVYYANQLGFGRFVLLGKGEEITGGRHRPALLADVFEAFIGALYLDQGIGQVLRFLEKFVYPRISQGEYSRVTDYKSQLQEFVQHDGLGEIQYRIVSERGPAHNREFISEILLSGRVMGQGTGRSKKEAEQNAAQAAMNQLKINQ